MNQETFMAFLGPLADKFSDPLVNEIRINPNGTIWEERRGLIYRVPVILPPVSIEFAAGSLSGEYNQPLNEKHPKLDVRLDDGSRVAILAPPIVNPGYAMTIRRFPQAYRLPDLIGLGTLSEDQAELLTRIVHNRLTLVVSGGTRTGKTTLTRTLLNLIPHQDADGNSGDRLLLVEQPAELNLDHSESRDIISIETRELTPRLPEFSAVDALQAVLRHSPDRIIFGELRGGEAALFLEALNTGHSGSMTTIHANSASETPERLTTLVRRGDPTSTRDVIVDTVARAVHVICHIGRDNRTGRRVVTEIVRTLGVSPDHSKVLTVPLAKGDTCQL